MHANPALITTVSKKVFARQFGQLMWDAAYREAMDLGDYDRAEEIVLQHPNLWARSTRLSFIENRRGNLDGAIELINRAEGEVSTKAEHADHLANLGFYSIFLGELQEGIRYGLEAVLLDHEVVSGAVNAACAASLLRSRRDLAAVLRVVVEQAPSVLVDPHWLERWRNDPQLAFARLVVNAPSNRNII